MELFRPYEAGWKVSVTGRELNEGGYRVRVRMKDDGGRVRYNAYWDFDDEKSAEDHRVSLLRKYRIG